VPPNCKFEIDDFEQEFAYRQKFDFMHGRELEGSIRDHDRLFAQCFENLRPGGYLEMQTLEVQTYSDDGSHLRAENFLKLIELVHKAAQEFNKGMDTVTTWKERLEKAGFKNVVEEKYKVCYPLLFNILYVAFRLLLTFSVVYSCHRFRGRKTRR
jgi:trans-aconitate methyltransferase